MAQTMKMHIMLMPAKYLICRITRTKNLAEREGESDKDTEGQTGRRAEKFRDGQKDGQRQTQRDSEL